MSKQKVDYEKLSQLRANLKTSYGDISNNLEKIIQQYNSISDSKLWTGPNGDAFTESLAEAFSSSKLKSMLDGNYNLLDAFLGKVLEETAKADNKAAKDVEGGVNV